MPEIQTDELKDLEHAVQILEGLADNRSSAQGFWILTAAAAHLQGVNHRHCEANSFVRIWWDAQDAKERNN